MKAGKVAAQISFDSLVLRILNPAYYLCYVVFPAAVALNVKAV